MRQVLHVCHTAQPGGSNEVMLSLLRHRPSHVRCDCVFLADGPVTDRAAALGARVAVVDSGRARQAWRAPGVVRRLRGAIRASGADTVLAHVTKAHLYAAPAARLEGVPYLWRQPEGRRHGQLMHEVAGRIRAGAVICSSHAIAAEQRRRWPATPVHTIHPGCEPAPGASRRHRAGAGDELVLGVVGRLQRWKRVELALRALPAILAAEPRARLRVIGGAAPGLDDDYPADLEREADRLGVGEAVDFLGHVTEGADAIAGLDVLVHTADHEPFGLVLVEAMLRNVPVVSVAQGGPTEILRDGEDGRLVAAEPPALATAAVELLRDPRRRARMGAAGHQRALERFTADRAARDIWAVVAQVEQRG